MKSKDDKISNIINHTKKSFVRLRVISSFCMNVTNRYLISFIELIEPRLISIENGVISTESEVFELDITRYSDASDLEDYFTQEFKEFYEYPPHSFIFYPRNMSYICGNLGKNIEWIEDDKPKFNFRLKIVSERDSSGNLLYWNGVNWPNEDEVNYATIPLTDELRKLDGHIIECHYVDSQWGFFSPAQRSHDCKWTKSH